MGVAVWEFIAELGEWGNGIVPLGENAESPQSGRAAFQCGVWEIEEQCSANYMGSKGISKCSVSISNCGLGVRMPGCRLPVNISPSGSDWYGRLFPTRHLPA